MKVLTSNRKWRMIFLALIITGIHTISFGNILYVTTSGTGGYYASIQTAIDDADAGDTIRVAEGTYYENILVNESLTLEGGWNAIFTLRNPESTPSVIDGQANGSVIVVPAGYTITIDGFDITNGNATGSPGWGGGMRIGDAGDAIGFTTVRNCVIRDNVASSAAPGMGEGGGIHVYNHHALIENNKIYRNIAQAAPDLSGKGGGIYTGWMANVTIKGNEITTNTAASSPIGYATGSGGGVHTLYSGEIILIEDNVIEGNIGTVDGKGEGGGCNVGANMYNNKVRYNIASKNGAGEGGGIYADYILDFVNNIISDNIASENGDGAGGGIYGKQLMRCHGNQISDNRAKRGGGIYLGESNRASIFQNVISNNQSTGNNHATLDGGGGISTTDNEAEIYENIITGNISNYAGGGIYVYDSNDVTVKNNLLQGNQAMGGGGLNVESSLGVIAQNIIRLNLSVWGGGIYIWGSQAPQFDRNIITENGAIGYAGFAGGGVTIALNSTAVVKLTNHIIARNGAGAGGYVGGLLVTGGACHLANCSIVDNNTGTNQEGLAFTSNHGTHSVFNTIVAGHTTGIYADAGVSIVLDYNDYYDNTNDLTGASPGAHDLTIDPQFRDRIAGNYHLIDASGIVDAGRTEPGVTTDFENDPRPRGAGFDIGADECHLSQAYVSYESGNDLTGDGSSGNPFATVTKALSEVEYNATIYVAEGTYPGIYILNRTVHLKGGYEDGAWTRDFKNHSTILHGEGLGCVVQIAGYFVFAEVEGFTITGGHGSMSSGPAGGVTIRDDASATIRYNLITGNIAESMGGGIIVYNSGGWPCVIERNKIHNNEALGQEFPHSVITGMKMGDGEPMPGGGVLIVGGPTRVVNNFISLNRCLTGGDGIAVTIGDNVRILHNSIAYNGAESGEGILLSGNPASYVVYNNIISGHHSGIKIEAGPKVDRDYNVYSDNVFDIYGGFFAAHEIGGDPCFADPGTGDLHIRQFSAARDAANTDAAYAVTFDIDQNARPNGLGADIGADEMYNSPPMLHFVTPSRLDCAARNAFLIRWIDEDYDDNASVTFYRDTDQKDFNGALLNGIISEDSATNELAMDTSGLSEGLYYIHTIITDGVNDPIVKYAPYPVIVTRITLAEMIDHILKRSEIPAGRQACANLNNDSGIDIADYIILMNLP